MLQQEGRWQDIINLYIELGEISKKYIETGILDIFSYKEYLTAILKSFRQDKLTFIRNELSKMI